MKRSLGHPTWFCLLPRPDVVGMASRMWGAIHPMGFLFSRRTDNELFELFLTIGCVAVDGGVVGNQGLSILQVGISALNSTDVVGRCFHGSGAVSGIA